MKCEDDGAKDDNTFRLVPTTGDKYTLYSSSKKRYCMLSRDVVSCSEETPDQKPTQKFEKVVVTGNIVAFKCYSGKFLFNAQNQIRCAAESVNDAEKFEMKVVGDTSKQEPDQKQPEPDKSTGKIL